jgi:NADH-quinone oxidoreductase subunit L
MFRLISLTFLGRFRGTDEQQHHLHESPPSMTLPLIVLAGLSIVGGWVGLPAVFGENANLFVRFLSPAFPVISGIEPAHAGLSHFAEWLLMGLSVAVAASGLFLAWKWYTKEEGLVPARIAASLPGLYALVADKFRVDELYDTLFVRPFDWLARMLWKVIDVLVIDGVLNATAFLIELTGDLLRFLQTGNARNYALTFLLGLVALLLMVVGAT